MQRRKMTLNETLAYLGEQLTTRVLIYFETHKELLEDANNKCAYKIAKNAFLRRKFGKFPMDMIDSLYNHLIKHKIECLSEEEKEAYKEDVYYLVDVVIRYDVASKYDDIF